MHQSRPRPTGSVPVQLLKSASRKMFRGQSYYRAKRLLRRVNCLSGKIRCLPDFVVLGAQKAGSSSLFFYLQQHPQVMLPINITKEVHFFDQHYSNGLDWYRGHFPLRSHRDIRSRLHRKRYISGEATPEYLIHPRCPERIARDLPDARLIVVLRDPVERAWSHYKMQVLRTAEKRCFEDAVAHELTEGPLPLDSLDDTELAGWNAGLDIAYLTRGLYARQLKNWLSFFPSDRLLVSIAEDMFSAPDLHYRQITEFLDIDPITPEDLRNLNQGGYKDEMNRETRESLRDFFEPDTGELANLLGRELPWK